MDLKTCFHQPAVFSHFVKRRLYLNALICTNYAAGLHHGAPWRQSRQQLHDYIYVELSARLPVLETEMSVPIHVSGPSQVRGSGVGVEQGGQPVAIVTSVALRCSRSSSIVLLARLLKGILRLLMALWFSESDHNFLPFKAPKKPKMPELPGASPPGCPLGFCPWTSPGALRQAP